MATAPSETDDHSTPPHVGGSANSSHRASTAALRERGTAAAASGPAARLRAGLRRGPLFFASVSLLSLLLLAFSTRPLHHTDLWGHLAYGRVIWNTQGLPATAPLLALSDGIAWVNTAWLSQLVGYAIFRQAGLAGLQFTFAVATSLCCGWIGHAVFRRTGGLFWPIAGVLVFLAISWQHLLIVRPQLFGLAAFCLLLHQLTRPRALSGWLIPGVPVLFAVWANAHGSFIMGLCLLAAFTGGRLFDVLWRTGRVTRLWRDRRSRQGLLLLGLALAGTLVNPYGMRLYRSVLTFADHPNLRALVEWDPLTLRMTQGQAAALAALLLVCVYRQTPRRITAAEVLMLVGFGGLMLWTSRMIVWWAPVAACAIAVHGHASWTRARSHRCWPSSSFQFVGALRRSRSAVARGRRHGGWTVAAVGVSLVCVGRTPLGIQVVSGRKPPLQRVVSADTPVAAVEFLNTWPARSEGLTYNSYEWGDYLLWAGHDLRVAVASHVHLIPPPVWNDYVRISNNAANSQELLDAYGYNLALIDFARRGPLITRLRKSAGWREIYSDNIAALFVRQIPDP